MKKSRLALISIATAFCITSLTTSGCKANYTEKKGNKNSVFANSNLNNNKTDPKKNKCKKKTVRKSLENINVDSYNNYNNKLYEFYFKKNNENKPADTEPNFKEMLSKYNGAYLGDTSKKVVYLTFDEGYENGYSGKILDVLKKNNVKAAFFVTGHYIDSARDLVKRMRREGHIVGNHTDKHPTMPLITVDRMKAEIDKLADKYAEVTGEDMVYFRPPKGAFSERSLKLTSDLGYKSIFWSYAYLDWDENRHMSEDTIYQKYMKNLHNGEIILMHAVSKENANVLDRIIKATKAKGYKFKTLDDIKFK